MYVVSTQSHFTTQGPHTNDPIGSQEEVLVDILPIIRGFWSLGVRHLSYVRSLTGLEPS